MYALYLFLALMPYHDHILYVVVTLARDYDHLLWVQHWPHAPPNNPPNRK
jgi:hypothetical protein